jgi:hypothetical protein
MIRTSIFQATGVNGWRQSSPFAGMSISAALPEYLAIDGLIEWEPLPGSAVDRVRWQERQRTVSISPAAAVEASWLLAQSQVPAHSVGIIERIATLVIVEAIDEDGVPITSWRLDGQEIFDGSLNHPDPLQGTIALAWYLRQDSINYWSRLPVIDALATSRLPGDDLVQSWTDDLHGWNARHWDQQQLVLPDASRQTLWLSVLADSTAWRISAKGRLGGYYQQRSGRDSAGASARKRS